jgi:hypothetical protein
VRDSVTVHTAAVFVLVAVASSTAVAVVAEVSVTSAFVH